MSTMGTPISTIMTCEYVLMGGKRDECTCYYGMMGCRDDPLAPPIIATMSTNGMYVVVG